MAAVSGEIGRGLPRTPREAVAALEARRSRRRLPTDPAFYDALAEVLTRHGRVTLDLAGARVDAETRPGSPAWAEQRAREAGRELAEELTRAPERLALPPGPLGRAQLLAELLAETESRPDP